MCKEENIRDAKVNLQRFWEVEELNTDQPALTEEEEASEKHFTSHVTVRTRSGMPTISAASRNSWHFDGDGIKMVSIFATGEASGARLFAEGNVHPVHERISLA